MFITRKEELKDSDDACKYIRELPEHEQQEAIDICVTFGIDVSGMDRLSTYRFGDMDIAPEDRMQPDALLALAVKSAKGWTELSLKKPDRVDIADYADFYQKELLETYGLIVAIDRLFE